VRGFLRSLAGAATAAAVCSLAAGCAGSSSAQTSNNQVSNNQAGGSSSAPTATSSKGGAKPAEAANTPAVPAARLSITPANSSHQIDPGAPIRVAAVGGTVSRVVVRTAGDPVTGTLSADKTSWRSSSTLNVGQLYTVTATAVNSAGAPVSRTSAFRTLTPAQTFTAQISENAGATYGVGMPIQVSFSQPVTNKAAVEKALRLRTSKPVVGAWYWLDDTHVDFRPRDYWPAHTQVSFTGRFNGVQAAAGVYGAANLSQSFAIGASVIVTASTTTHHMQLYVNGKKKYDWPISTGKPGDDTPNGTYVTIAKSNPEEMKPAGIAPGQPGYYDLMVPWATRFTWSGMFLHDAYWSVGQQGYTNVSHGCVNMPPAAAEIYYNMAVPGNPVTVTDSPVAGSPGDGWTDWFYSWSQVLARTATHQAVSAGPGGSSFVRPSAAPASTATAPLGRPADGNSAAA